MDIDQIFKLFDSYWFEKDVFKKQKHSSKLNFEESPDLKNEEKPEISPIFTKIPTFHKRSMSDELSSTLSFDSCSLSPDSVLLRPPPQLQTIHSGKEVTQLSEDELNEPIKQNQNQKIVKSKRKKKKVGSSKSLSELEFEELKGFMDLGFVFSEEDKDSKLVEIIPGLQRLREKDDEFVDVDESFHEVSRPYLSEAWEVLYGKRNENPLMNWRIPSFGNEIDMKDNLKWWAHTVASTVR